MARFHRPSIEAIESVGKLSLLTVSNPNPATDGEKDIVEVGVAPGLVLGSISSRIVFFSVVDK